MPEVLIPAHIAARLEEHAPWDSTAEILLAEGSLFDFDDPAELDLDELLSDEELY